MGNRVKRLWPFMKADYRAAEEYLQLAQDGGWEIAAADYGFAFFVSCEGEEPAPMQTDWQNGYRQIRKSFWRQDIPMGIILLLALALINSIENFELWDLLTHSFTGIGLTVFCFGVFLKQMIIDWFV